ncbi:MAG: hypothetical protein ABIG44_18375 [Planctomycetota bacterium]
MMKYSRLRTILLTVTLAGGAYFLPSCQAVSFLNDCFGDDTISSAEYHDMNSLERMLYEENWCGRYSRQTNFWDSLFD